MAGSTEALACLDQYWLGASGSSGLQVAQGITDGRYPGQVNPQSPGNVVKHAGFGFATVTIIVRTVRAKEYSIDKATGRADPLLHGLVDAGQGVEVK